MNTPTDTSNSCGTVAGRCFHSIDVLPVFITEQGYWAVSFSTDGRYRYEQTDILEGV
jgi:hypothetical protein